MTDPTFFLQMSWKGAYQGLDPSSYQIAVYDSDPTSALFQAHVDCGLPPSTPQGLNLLLFENEYSEIQFPLEKTTTLVINIASKCLELSFEPRENFHYRLELEQNGDAYSVSCKPMQYISLRYLFSQAIGALDDRELVQQQAMDCLSKISNSQSIVEGLKILDGTNEATLQYLIDLCDMPDGINRETNLIGLLMSPSLFAYLEKHRLSLSQQDTDGDEEKSDLVHRQSMQRMFQFSAEQIADINQLWTRDTVFGSQP